LVRSRWDKEDNTSKQEMIKYLGKASDVTLADIPAELHKDPKILTFISKHMHSSEEKRYFYPMLKSKYTIVN
jgi:hypothetical protein